MKELSPGEERSKYIYYVLRILMLFTVVYLFVPGLNPAKICSYVNKTMSLFTSGIAYSSLTADAGRALTRGWISEGCFKIIFFSSMVACVGAIAHGISGCMSLGSLKMKKTGCKISFLGSIFTLGGMGGLYMAYTQLQTSANLDQVAPALPLGYYVFLGISVIILILNTCVFFILPKPGKSDVYEMEPKFKLFLMMLPFIVMAFVFCYLPLWGWRYAFYDYKAGGTLSADNFVGFRWFTILFENEATRADVLRVLKNTLIMSGLGLATSWCAMAFAIFLCEIKCLRARRIIQTLTTIPNFISWVLVYAVACVIFSSDGLISNLIQANGGTAVNFLMSGDHIWIKMLLWGMWKGLGWSAIIYIAGISGIDQQLYEAATVDGAGRFQKMWHVTVPGLIPTFCVLLLMAIAGILSNGMDQYMVFENANNAKDIMVLDLYVYELGIGKGNIPMSTLIGMVKSIVSVILLFGANAVSKLLRGESII